jgi:hypothetical protein
LEIEQQLTICLTLAKGTEQAGGFHVVAWRLT